MRLQRPVRLALTRIEDFAASNPAPGELIELEAGATAEGDLTGVRGRIVLDRGSNDEFGFEALAALLAVGPLPLAGARHRAPTACSPTASASAPTARRRRRRRPSRSRRCSTSWPRELGLDPIELRLRNVLHEGDQGLDGKPFPVFGAAECLERLRAHPLWERRGSLPEGEGVGVAIGWWPGGLEPAAASCRLDADGHLTIVTGAVDMSGTETVFQSIAAEAFGLSTRVGPRRGRRHRRRALRGAERRQQGHLHRRAAPSSAPPSRRASGCSRWPPAELEIAPEDLEIVDGAVRPIGSPDRGVAHRRARLQGAQLRQPLRAGRGLRRHRADQPRTGRRRAPVPRPRRPRDRRGDAPAPRHRPGRRPRAEPRARRRPARRRRRRRASAGRCSSSSPTTTTGQLRTGSFVEYAMPTIDTVPPIDAEIVEVPAPTARSAPRASASRRSSASRRRWPTRSPRRPGCACATCR